MSLIFFQINISSEDWMFEAHLEGQCFHGPAVINVPVGETVPYPLTFTPVAESVITVREKLVSTFEKDGFTNKIITSIQIMKVFRQLVIINHLLERRKG